MYPCQISRLELLSKSVLFWVARNLPRDQVSSLIRWDMSELIFIAQCRVSETCVCVRFQKSTVKNSKAMAAFEALLKPPKLARRMSISQTCVLTVENAQVTANVKFLARANPA